MENTYHLQGLIDFGMDLLPHMQQFLDSPEIIEESKEFITANIILIDNMIQVAVHFEGTKEQEDELIQVFKETLEENYNFLRKLLGH